MKVSRRSILLGSAATLALLAVAGPASRWARSELMARRGLSAFVRLIGAANAQDLGAVRALCSARYLASREPETSPGGGMVGIPRNIHRNFRVWREGEVVYVCPTDRASERPVYRLILEGDGWKFDGPAGLLRPGVGLERGEIP